MGHEFRARNLTDREWNCIEDFRRAVEKKKGRTMNDKELLLWVAGEGA
jgi:hypothetical protein